MDQMDPQVLADPTPWATNRDMAESFEKGKAVGRRELRAELIEWVSSRDHVPYGQYEGECDNIVHTGRPCGPRCAFSAAGSL